MKLKFQTPEFDTLEKDLVLGYIDYAEVKVDYDDVDHNLIQEIVPLIVKAVNAIPQKEINAAVKRAQKRNEE